LKKSNQNQSKIQQAKIQKTRNPKTIRILRNSPHETLQKNTPKIGLCSNFKQNHGLKTKFFSKKQNPGVFLCVSVSKTRKKVYC
jgi:hypothetical protein